MLSNQIIKDYAQALDDAEKNRVSINPLTMSYPDMTIEDAYAIQKTWMDIKFARGRKPVGMKIGLTSRAMQLAMKIDEPDFGILLDDMVFENHSTIRAADFVDLRVEVEIAFMLKKDLEGESLTLPEVLDATDYIVPALEFIAARSHRVHPETKYVRTVLDTISDNAANAGLITGDVKACPSDIDLPWVSSVLYFNGAPEETGVAAGVLGHPAKGIIWLARRIAPFGMKLKAGELILSGSFTRPVVCSPGDKFTADYGPLGIIKFDVA